MLSNVRLPPTFVNVCGTGVPLASHVIVWLTYVRSTSGSLRLSQTVMLCRSLIEPWKLMTWPVAGSNSTGIVSRYVNGTPIVTNGGPAGFALSIFSTGISRFWQFCWIVLDEPLTNQILWPATALQAI